MLAFIISSVLTRFHLNVLKLLKMNMMKDSVEEQHPELAGDRKSVV